MPGKSIKKFKEFLNSSIHSQNGELGRFKRFLDDYDNNVPEDYEEDKAKVGEIYTILSDANDKSVKLLNSIKNSGLSDSVEFKIACFQNIFIDSKNIDKNIEFLDNYLKKAYANIYIRDDFKLINMLNDDLTSDSLERLKNLGRGALIGVESASSFLDPRTFSKSKLTRISNKSKKHYKEWVNSMKSYWLSEVRFPNRASAFNSYYINNDPIEIFVIYINGRAKLASYDGVNWYGPDLGETYYKLDSQESFDSLIDAHPFLKKKNS